MTQSFTILVDVHEPTSAEDLLRALGHRPERRALGALDYAVWDGDTLLLIAERKTHRDLVLSMMQPPARATAGGRRLWAQMDRFDAIPGEAKVWLYERPDGTTRYPAQFAQGTGALLSAQERGILLLPTRSLDESMRALVTAARRILEQRPQAAL